MINQIIATIFSIPLGLVSGYYLAKAIPEEHKIIKKHHKSAIAIATIILLVTIVLTITKHSSLITISIPLLLMSIIVGVKIQINKDHKNHGQKK